MTTFYTQTRNKKNAHRRPYISYGEIIRNTREAGRPVVWRRDFGAYKLAAVDTVTGVTICGIQAVRFPRPPYGKRLP